MPSSKRTEFESITEMGETEEPSGNSGNSDVDHENAPVSTGAATGTLSQRTQLKHSRVRGVISSSAQNSPKHSRESSPVRPNFRSTTPSKVRSRQNSVDQSPSRKSSATGLASSTVPSAAAVQRALSSAALQSLQPTVISEDPVKPAKQSSTPGNISDKEVPHWPTSPRLKSQQPVSLPARLNLASGRKVESTPATPNIVVQSPSTSSSLPIGNIPPARGPETEEQLSSQKSRSTSRGVSANGSKLATVRENSVPESDTSDAHAAAPSGKSSGDEKPRKVTENSGEEGLAASTRSLTESGSESGSNGGATSDLLLRRNSAAPGTGQTVRPIAPSRSFTALPVKSKTIGEGSAQIMTVETETVSSIPQVAVGGGTGERGNQGRVEGGSLRMKASTETIRPKKDKKKTSRKAPSLNPGTTSSKADFFEAKVASAVDEANSSDSDETFVYESNPPESRPSRYHSRTPSVASTQSHAEPRGGLRSAPLEGHHSVAGKRSMKFTNNPFGGPAFPDADTGSIDSSATGRGSGATSGSGTHHHHFGRWGRPGKTQHASVLGNESPFPQGNKAMRSNAAHPFRSAPASPKNARHLRGSTNGTRSPQKSSYDIDMDGEVDERSPLINSLRTPRGRAHRPGGSSLRQTEYTDTQQRNCLTRFAGCLLLTVTILLVISGALGFLFATTKPLLDVRVHEIQNVLASEQELMLDLLVKAVNPNVISLTVSNMDVNIFAKSSHVGTEKFWRDKRKGREQRRVRISPYPYRTADGIDEGNDPIEDPAGDPQTMLLGRIFEFDSALTFDGSPVKRHSSSSVGEVRLAQPGNKTEEGGSERWEQVLQHPFELIVRGVLKYQLPISSRVRTTPIGASVIVHPEKGVDELGRMQLERLPSKPYRPGSNVPLHKPGTHSPERIGLDE